MDWAPVVTRILQDDHSGSIDSTLVHRYVLSYILQSSTQYSLSQDFLATFGEIRLQNGEI